MKLKNPTDVYKGDTAGPNAEIVDQLLHASPTASKRTRTARSKLSSLDYKVVKDQSKGEEAPTTTKPIIRKDAQQQQAEQQQQQQQQQQQYYRRGLTTRARGSSGPPPRRYDLSDLEGMTEEQLLQALYEDPELATAATKAAEESQQKPKREKRSSVPTSAPTGAKKSREGSRFYRGADGIAADSAEYPDHLKEMMDQGVPVVQWVVLLLIVVVGLWSLRKTLVGPDKTSPATSAERGKVKGKKAKKGKPRKAEIPETLVKSLLDDKPDAKPASTRSVPSKKASNALKKQAPKKKKKQANGVAKKEVKPNSEGEPDKATTRATNNIPIHREPEEDGAWLPVTKSQKATAPEPPKQSKPKEPEPVRSFTGSAGKPNNDAKKEAVPAANDSAEDPTESSMPELTEEVPIPVETKEVAEAPAAAKEVAPTSNGGEKNPAPANSAKSSKKKKKAAGQAEPVAPAAAPSTDADAELARKLHKEEETLAKKSSAKKSTAEDAWEEVTIKKKKGKNVATA
jgi:hypothetical protein